MTARTMAKLEAWKRAGLYGPKAIGEQIAVLEKENTPEAKGDVRELGKALEAMSKEPAKA